MQFKPLCLNHIEHRSCISPTNQPWRDIPDDKRWKTDETEMILPLYSPQCLHIIWLRSEVFHGTICDETSTATNSFTPKRRSEISSLLQFWPVSGKNRKPVCRYHYRPLLKASEVIPHFKAVNFICHDSTFWLLDNFVYYPIVSVNRQWLAAHYRAVRETGLRP